MAPQQALDLTKIPLGVNPSGAPPDFINPPTLIDGALGTGLALVVVGGICLVFRLGTNLKLSKRLRLDDCMCIYASAISIRNLGSLANTHDPSEDLCIFAFAGGIAYWILNLLNSEHGLARHTWDTPLSTFTISVMQRQTAILFVIAPTLWASKAAILALYIRMFGTVTWLRRLCWVWIAFMALFYGLNIVAAGAYCVPRKGEMWGGDSFTRCSSSAWLHVVVGAFSMIADLIILILPFPVVMRLRVSRVKKVFLGLLFSTGILLVVMSAVSLWLRIIIFQQQDATWNATLLEMVSIIEVFGTVAVSCAPAISAFWLKIFTKTKLWTKLKSTSVFSYLQSRFLRSRSSLEEKPSFVATPRLPIPEQSDSSTASTKDAQHAVSEACYEDIELPKFLSSV